MIIRKSPAEIDSIAASGAILVRTLHLLERQIRPGVTTAELDAAAERYIRSQGGVPTFKGYRGFPGSICASPNSMIVHGIPGPYALERGDVISLDVGVTLDGWVSDAARTFAVGPVGVLAQSLLDATERSLMAAVEQCIAGNRLGDVSHAVQASAEADPSGGGDGPRDRADDDRRRAIGACRHRRLVDLFTGRIAHRALRVHGRDHGRWATRADALAPSRRRGARTW